jgi:hypothetical protein
MKWHLEGGIALREVAIHRAVVRVVRLAVGMIEVPWNGFRSASFAVGVIGTLDFVGDSVMRWDIPHVTSRREVKFVGYCRMIVFLGILDR